MTGRTHKERVHVSWRDSGGTEALQQLSVSAVRSALELVVENRIHLLVIIPRPTPPVDALLLALEKLACHRKLADRACTQRKRVAMATIQDDSIPRYGTWRKIGRLGQSGSAQQPISIGLRVTGGGGEWCSPRLVE